jgi:GNAT superfamily N-acetyltransferase
MSMNACPALHTLACDGWILRFSDGYTRRANSVNPLYPSSSDLAPKIALCERLYRERGLPTVFKLTEASEPRDLEATLVERGYESVAQTGVYVTDLADPTGPAGAEVETAWSRTAEWREAFHRMHHVAPERQAVHDRILASISLPTGFAVARQDGCIVGCALGVVQDEWLGAFDVVVDEACRRQGHGKRLMQGLSAWGRAMGARRAYLQVMRENAAALSLYERLGFQEAYSYWYRVSG